MSTAKTYTAPETPSRAPLTTQELSIFLEILDIAGERVQDVETKELVSLGRALVQAVRTAGLSPWVEQADRVHWEGGSYLIHDRQPGARAIGLNWQLQAMTRTPGLGDALVQIISERLTEALALTTHALPRID